MSYIVDKNRNSGFAKKSTFDLQTVDSSARSFDSPKYLFYELEPAEVVDIILDDKHPDYRDFRDIGKCKIRLIYSNNGQADIDLPYSKPLHSNIRNYPLLHEIVIVVEYLEELYYCDKLNILNGINNNAVPFISISPESNEVARASKNDSYDAVINSGTPNISGDVGGNDDLGNTFKLNNSIIPLQVSEGDVILEGRFGNSIRLGSNTNTGNPVIKLRAGQPDNLPGILDSPYVVENINDDYSSLWITSDESIPIIPATRGISSNLEFASGIPATMDGKQITVNSDRIIFNAKREQIIGYAQKSINFVSGQELTLDTDGKFITNSKKETVVNSPKILLGAESADEPIVLGNKTASWLNRLLSALIAHTHASGTGPTSPTLPPHLAELQKLQQEIGQLLSNQNFSL